MNHPGTILDKQGRSAAIVGISPDGSQLVLRTEDGREAWIERSLLNEEAGHWKLPESFDRLFEPRQAPSGKDQFIMPVMEERLHVERQTVETGTVRLEKRVHERQEVVEQPVYREDVQIERVAVNQVVEQAPSIRYEGETMVIPLVEEVIVVEKRLMLREEVRVSRRHETVARREPVTLRSEEVVVNRTEPERD